MLTTIIPIFNIANLAPPFPNQTLSTDHYLKHLITSVELPQLFLDDLEHWSRTVRVCAGKPNDKPNVLNLGIGLIYHLSLLVTK